MLRLDREVLKKVQKTAQVAVGVAAILGQIGPTFAAVTATPVFVQTPNRGVVQLTTASTPGTYVTLYTGSVNGSKCIGAYITSNDTVAHLVTIQYGSSNIRYGGVAIPTSSQSGFSSGNPALNPFGSNIWPGLPIDNDTNPFLYLGTTADTLQVTFGTSLTTGAVINVVSVCADF